MLFSEEDELSSELLADTTVVVTISKICNRDPVDPASITIRNGEDGSDDDEALHGDATSTS